MPALSEDPNVPVLEGGWVSLPEAAKVLGLTRQQSYKMAQQGQWKTIRRIGSSPTFVVNMSEVKEHHEARTATPEEVKK